METTCALILSRILIFKITEVTEGRGSTRDGGTTIARQRWMKLQRHDIRRCHHLLMTRRREVLAHVEMGL
jgi:hypothetical protein